MPSITALIHTHNDALRLGRLLETLYPCDRIVVVDHGSEDSTLHVARDYATTILPAEAGTLPARHIGGDPADWILCLSPRESLTEALAASLFEWKSEKLPASVAGFSVFLREETIDGWVQNPEPQMRLVPGDWNLWMGDVPIHDSSALALEGELLHFIFP